MDNIELMSIHLDIDSKVVLDSMFTVPIVFCNVGGHAVTQHI